MPQLTDILNIYPSPVYQVLNVNWSAFVKGILLTLRSQAWNNGTHGGCQLGNEDLGLLPLTKGPTIVSLAIVWASWLLPPHPPTPHRPTSPHCPSHPPPLLAILTAERDGKKCHQIQPSEIEKVSYNKIQ